MDDWMPAVGELDRRRLLVGAGSGLLLALFLLVLGAPPLVVASGPLFGLVYVLAFSPASGTPLDHALTGTALAIPAWALLSITVQPVLTGASPAWTTAEMAERLPELIGWTVGATLCAVATGQLDGRTPADAAVDGPSPGGTVRNRIVIVGGGFAGVAAAKQFERKFGPDPSVEIVLVSETNALLYTPMLAEIAAGSLEPSQITSPYRSTLRRTKVINATAEDADFGEETLFITASPDRKTSRPDEPAEEWESIADGGHTGLEALDYDHLILTTGAETNYFGMDDVEEFAFDLKTLRDAILIRNHVITCFERAERIDDPERQAELLTFVVTGGGFAGTELAGGLNDFAHELLSYYPDIPPDAVSVVLIHSRERIMQALTDSLSDYALEVMRDRGVEFRLESRVTGADPEAGEVILTDGDRIRTETLVWTAGVRPDPLIEELDVPLTDFGAVDAESTFAVPGCGNVWAAGDCASVEDPETGDPHPTTAQYASRAGKHLANNVYRSVTGTGELEPMMYKSKGQLAVIGHNAACAELANRQFSGLSAWLLWRGVYLSKLPGADRKIRVLLNWIVELLFPRDLVITVDIEREEARQ